MQTRMKISIRNLLTVVLLFCINSHAIADIAVIVSTNSGVTNLSGSEIKSIYLGNNKEFKPFNQPHGSDIKKKFLDHVVGMSENDFKKYWFKILFSGKGIPPKTLEGDTDVKNHVSGTANGIGFIDLTTVDNSVKVIYTIP